MTVNVAIDGVQLDRGALGTGKEPGPVAQQDRDDVKPELVDDAGTQVVPDDGGATFHAGVLLSGSGLCQAIGERGAGPSATARRPSSATDQKKAAWRALVPG